jgi:SWI/SNF-related matrix-associated actin-dependent regulator 1 of chromatin subfamily A
MVSLREHQRDGVAFLLANPHGYLAHRPGLGKTRTLIAAAQLAGVQRPLIVAPAIVRTHWYREFTAMGWDATAPAVRSYDEIMRGGTDMLRDLMLNYKVDALILDEAHYLKHGSARRTSILLGKDGYARRLPIVWPASGTPMPRNPAELWTLLASVFPWVLAKYGIRTRQQFTDRYCITRRVRGRGGVWRDKIVGNNPEHIDELRAMLSEIMQVREPGDDVPAIDWQILRLDSDQVRFADEDLWLGPVNDAIGMMRDIRDGKIEAGTLLKTSRTTHTSRA